MMNLLIALLVSVGFAQTPTPEERIARLEAIISQIQDEQTKTKLEKTVPPSIQKSFFGYGPAFSTVYFNSEPFSVGAMSDFLFEARKSAPDLAGMNEFKLFLGYRLATNFVFHSALAIDLGSPARPNADSDNSLHLDFAYLDWLASDDFTLRTGLVPVPLGLRRLSPEPTLYPDPLRPRVEEWLLPFDATRPGILALFEINRFRFHAGAIASPEARRLNDGTFIEGGLGSRFRNGQFDESETFAGVLRADYSFNASNANGREKHELLAGLSHIQGDAAHRSSGLDDANFTISEAHVRLETNRWQLIGLGAIGQLNNTGDIQSVLNVRPGSRARGWSMSLYREVLMKPRLASLMEGGVFASFEGFELENADIGVSRAARVGFNVRPIPNIVVKVARQWRLSSDLDNDLWQVSLGALF